jgi:hypothetical protein
MISNIEDLISFTNNLEIILPQLKGKIALNYSGCPKEEIDKIKNAFPKMPKTYLDFVKQIDLVGKSIGYFQLAPNSEKGETLYEKLNNCNIHSAFKEVFQMNEVYQIGSWEADPICIVYKSNQLVNGQIVKLNSEIKNQKPDILANSFVDYLLIVGNLELIKWDTKFSENSNKKVKEFKSIVARFALDLGPWLNLSNVLID